MNNQFKLMKDRRFLPLFIAQFFGAFNDNLFKTTLSVLAAYGIWQIEGWRPEILVSLAAGLFILPFVIFAPLAGELADKYDKSRLMRLIKLAEIVIVAVAIGGLVLQSVPVLLSVLFMLGMQAAFFNPNKFSILPQHLEADELIGANALLNTGTYLAILSGTILGGVLAFSKIGLSLTGFLLVVCGAAGYAASFYIAKAAPPAPDLKLKYNLLREAIVSLRFARSQPDGIFHAMIGSAWFFFVGAMILSQLPNFTKQALGVDNIVLTFFMTVFSVGISLGGLVNNRLLRSRVEITFVPLAAFLMAAFSIDLYFASIIYREAVSLLGDYLLTLPAFLSRLSGWRIVFDLFAISLAGGIYIVPLKALVQDRAEAGHRARVIASGTLLDALFILSSSIVAVIVLSSGFVVEHLFLLLASGSIVMAFYIHSSLSGKPLRTIFKGTG